ncbi:MAG: NADH:flavin oxidoreductase [Alphaproteobacteria bacterium]|nr:NADH:flavin oxidoreductase [Alphaproteobacteria bacterium]
MNILLTPARIGPVEIPNRIVMPPMTTRSSDEAGFVTEDALAYYAARVRGGVGLITVEMASPEKAGRHRFRELGIYDDRFIPGLRRLVDMIHAGGSKASIQLGHGGGHTRIDISGETPVAPSAIPHPVYEITFETIVPEAMSVARIAAAVAAYAAAAVRSREAGFDCVEIHAAHGYLISQFHTPFENRRTDAYGGALANRARFGLEVLRAVKAAAPTLGVVYRLSVEDYFPDGMPYEEGREIAVWAAEAGADALHISAGHYRSLPSAARMNPTMALPEATFLGYASGIKARVKVPVIAVGRLGDPAVATAAVAEGKADFVAIGRPLVADPDWVAKLRRGAPIRRCLACNTCINEMRGGIGISCVVNGMAGRERAFADARPPQGERIAVIGAGPRRAHLCRPRRRRQQRHPVRARGRAGRRVPPRRQGAAVPGGRGASFGVRALHRRPGRRLHAPGRRHPLRHRRPRRSGAARAVRPPRRRDRRARPLRPRRARPCSTRSRGRALAGAPPSPRRSEAPRLVLLPRAHADRRPHPRARPPRPDRDRDRRCGRGGQEQGGDPERLRRGTPRRRRAGGMTAC